MKKHKVSSGALAHPCNVQVEQIREKATILRRRAWFEHITGGVSLHTKMCFERLVKPLRRSL